MATSDHGGGGDQESESGMSTMTTNDDPEDDGTLAKESSHDTDRRQRLSTIVGRLHEIDALSKKRNPLEAWKMICEQIEKWQRCDQSQEPKLRRIDKDLFELCQQ